VSIPPAWPQVLDFFGTPLVIEPSPGQLSSDAGLLPIRQFDQRIGLTRAFAGALDDPRDPDLTEHTFLEMVRSRVYGILAGYEDQNDHDTLRKDPVFKLVADRSPTTPTWQVSQRCPASRTPSRSSPSSVCATCSSTSSSPPSTRRRAA
jgi:Transposase DDE domain group 1